VRVKGTGLVTVELSRQTEYVNRYSGGLASPLPKGKADRTGSLAHSPSPRPARRLRADGGYGVR
jgi:hypothetical protein